MAQVRRGGKGYLRAIGAAALRASVGLALLAACVAAPLRADDAVAIALRLTPGSYERTEQLVHLVTFDMSKTLKSMAAGRAEDTTILESRDNVFVVRDGGAVTVTETNTRRYGGDHPKESDSKARTMQWQGTIAPDGVHTPPRDVLEDPGDGAIDQLPDIPLAVGQQWTFTRPIKAERDLGTGSMTYTDKVTRIEERAGHRMAIIAVTGVGSLTPPKDMLDHGFKAAPMDFSGTAEFDTTLGLPGTQHYSGMVRWHTTIMFQKIGVVFNDTYDASPLNPKQSATASASGPISPAAAATVPAPAPTRTKPPY